MRPKRAWRKKAGYGGTPAPFRRHPLASMSIQPLTGIRVLDFTHVLAGPYATHVLCQLGADVIKIERPGVGDVMRAAKPGGRMPPGFGAQFVALNAGKRSVAVDLKSEAGRDAVRRIAETVDVAVENLRPGELDKLGLGHEALSAINPNLIYCTISGWGLDGPLASRPGYDQIFQAALGMMMTVGERADDPPMKIGFPMIDIATGMNAATAILAALTQRDRDGGQGRRLDVAMSDSALHLMIGPVAKWMIGGERNERIGNKGLTGSPTAGVFPTAGGWLALAANTREHAERVLDLIGVPDWRTDPRFASVGVKGGFFNVAQPDAALAAVSAALLAKDAEHWERVFNEAGVAAGKARTVEEFLDGPYRTTAGTRRRIAPPYGLSEQIEILGAGFRVDGETPGTELPPPRLGQHTRMALDEIGMTAGEIDALVAAKAVQTG